MTDRNPAVGFLTLAGYLMATVGSFFTVATILFWIADAYGVFLASVICTVVGFAVIALALALYEEDDDAE